MSIEQSFRDDKPGGFNLEHARLQHVQRIDRLLLAAAIAALRRREAGEFVLKQGEDARRQVDPVHMRTLSLFQLGLRWLKRFWATQFSHLPAFISTLSNIRLKPRAIYARTLELRKVSKIIGTCYQYFTKARNWRSPTPVLR